MRFLLIFFLINFLLAQCHPTKISYTFYNNKGEVVTIQVPERCEPGVGTFFPMWTNQTFYCSQKHDHMFIFYRAVMWFPYEYTYVCDSPKNYTILSDCEP